MRHVLRDTVYEYTPMMCGGECVLLCEKFLDEKSFSWMKKVSVGTQCVTVGVCVCFWMDEQTEITEGLPVVEPTYAHPHTTHAHAS